MPWHVKVVRDVYRCREGCAVRRQMNGIAVAVAAAAVDLVGLVGDGRREGGSFTYHRKDPLVTVPQSPEKD